MNETDRGQTSHIGRAEGFVSEYADVHLWEMGQPKGKCAGCEHYRGYDGPRDEEDAADWCWLKEGAFADGRVNECPAWISSQNTMNPEVSLTEVANGNFAGMARPILVAAATQDQLEEFMWREGFLCHELRRFRDHRWHRGHPAGKVLVLLPGFWNDPYTDTAVRWWVEEQDRYTVLLDAEPKKKPVFPWQVAAMVAAGLVWCAATAVAAWWW